MKTTLIIMAAGIGSRFGGGIKQLEKMGSNGEIIMDYSIYDAVEAGFDKVVFIIRKDIEEEFRSVIGNRIGDQIEVEYVYQDLADFKEIIGNRIGKQVEVDYVFQDINDIPEGFTVPEGRTKPWGTGQAVLCCKGVVKEPFLVINADDYYGKEAFVKMHDFLLNHEEDKERFRLGMAGYILKNTLSDNGTVTRGVCVVDEKSGYLEKILETHSIYADEKGKVHCEEADVAEWIHPDVNVSMNMWAGYPDFIDYLEEGFREFLAHIEDNPMKKEYLLPNIVELLLNQDKATVKVYETADRWFGVTYLEDKPFVVDSIRGLIKDGVYPENLWA